MKGVENVALPQILGREMRGWAGKANRWATEANKSITEQK